MTAAMAYVLTVSGSDSSGCAGMQADNRVIQAAGAMALNVITANTLQIPEKVPDVRPIEATVVERQMRALLEAYPVGAIKIGLLGGSTQVKAIAGVLADYPDIFVVLDPILFSSGGHKLLAAESMPLLNTALMPHVDLLTPNLKEEAYVRPARETTVLVKGGHMDGETCTDTWIFPDGHKKFFSEPRISTRNDRGTGCILSSGIAAGIAKGSELMDAYLESRQYLSRALQKNIHTEFVGSGPSF